jgi:hypothetical protein
MYYGNYPYGGWFYPGANPFEMGYTMPGAYNYPYGYMGNNPYYQPNWFYNQPCPAPPPPFYQPNYQQQAMPEGTPMQPFYPNMPPEQEIEFLRGEAKMLKERIDQIDVRISELNSQPGRPKKN